MISLTKTEMFEGLPISVVRLEWLGIRWKLDALPVDHAVAEIIIQVHAVYPSIDQDQLARMTVDQIIMRYPTISRYLGTTKHVFSKDSKAFAVEISTYIDSKDQKRGQKKGKKGKDDKKKDKNDKDGKKKDSNGVTDNDPALWPLIRQVVVKCQAAALSTGAILVDLPGVADANAARSNICKDYMKKCNCIWVLAPITRAVDDRTAKGAPNKIFPSPSLSIHPVHRQTS
jgi:Dynamin family